MAQAPKFYELNKIDLNANETVAITITDAVASDTGSAIVDLLRNRRNSDGWATTDSTDAANTQIDVDMGDDHFITDIFLLQINFKAYTVQYWDGAAYQDFSTPIAETTNAVADMNHSFTSVETDKIRIIITGAFVVDDDKFMTQLIITNLLGQFTTGFKIEKVVNSVKRKSIVSLSGKKWVKRSVGAFSFMLSKKNVADDTDLTLVETLHDFYYGFTVWLSGGDVSQFRNERIGYRLKDIFVMNLESEYTPEWDDGFYVHGINLKMKLTETI